MKIKEMVTSEMPRERLLSHGAKSLSNTELLAILINTGRKGFSSIDISNELLKSASNLNELLNSKNVVIKETCVFKGTLNSSIVHPREIFSIAVRENANAIIAVHNHPSGDVTPSQEDIITTMRLKECGLILGIDLLDHIIIGDNRFTSLVEAGYFDEND
ncbi:JAB domain-containing protein [Staphylococcus aureus]|uniref:JAB domain-containing protein n=1 Tax=Staphylococcus aureus TaxID=1280 RepID=UPI00307614DB